MLKSAIRRWRERRRERRARALEKQFTVRENLRNWQPPRPSHTPRQGRTLTADYRLPATRGQ